MVQPLWEIALVIPAGTLSRTSSGRRQAVVLATCQLDKRAYVAAHGSPLPFS